MFEINLVFQKTAFVKIVLWWRGPIEADFQFLLLLLEIRKHRNRGGSFSATKETFAVLEWFFSSFPAPSTEFKVNNGGDGKDF